MLAEAGLSIAAGATRLGVSRQQLTRLLGGKSALSAEMALRLERVFGVSAKELISLQMTRDLEGAQRAGAAALAALRSYRPSKSPMRAEATKRLRAHKDELRKRGIERLYLFGSVARDEARAGSDVDLFFESGERSGIGLIELQRLESRIGEILGAEVDLVPADGLGSSVRVRAERDAIRIF
ncbi:MAG: HigA family addiction module antitoxin [Parvularculaceae bacterium]